MTTQKQEPNKGLFTKEIVGLETALGVLLVAVVSKEGILLGAVKKETTEPLKLDFETIETTSALLTTVLGAAENAAKEVNLGVLSPIEIKAEQGKIIVVGAGPKVFLLVITEKDIGNFAFSKVLENAINAIQKKAEKLILE